MSLIEGMTLAPAAPEDDLDGRKRFAELDAKRQSSIEWLRLESGDEALQLLTGEMFGPLAALESCMAAVKRKGEPEQSTPGSKATAPTPATYPGDWFFGSDLPKDLGPQPIDGIATVKLAVDSEGRVSGCEVSSSMGYKALGIEACRKFSERAIFFPARDEAGEAVDGTYTGSIKYLVSR